MVRLKVGETSTCCNPDELPEGLLTKNITLETALSAGVAVVVGAGVAALPPVGAVFVSR